MERYEPEAIEPRWQRVWDDERAFETPNPEPGQRRRARRRTCSRCCPYPSGELHMGHVLNYTMGDVVAHFRRRRGYQRAAPDGLRRVRPAGRERRHQRGRAPARDHRRATSRRSACSAAAWAGRSTGTASSRPHDPEYYRWTQWLFLRFLERGLAYRKEAPVNWCPVDQTVLANEQVIDGHCERCGAEVEARNLTQWYFRITDYADALLDEMELLESWPERVLTMQRNWIGRSEGARVVFRVAGDRTRSCPVFTTRPDTLFGATFFVLAPEHPLVAQLVAARARDGGARVRPPRRRRARRSSARRRRRTASSRAARVNPVNGEQIPIWVADYVLMGYGTGAIMAVPAHDERDHAFAQRYGLPIRQVVAPASGEVDGAATARTSRTPRTRCSSTRASSRACAPGGEAGDRRVARRARARRRRPIGYRLRDWLLSRQRYWGARSRSSTASACGLVPVPDDQLPVLLPEVEDYLPKGRSPLAAAEDWVNVDCPRCGGPARRETDTMDTFVDSSWYFIRYADPNERPGAVRPRDRRLLAAGQPVHRRRRARDPAPAVRALLHEGDARHGPASASASRSRACSTRG